MRFRILLLIAAFLMTFTAYVQALEPERVTEIKENLNKYIRAVKAKSQWRTKKAFYKLSEDKEAMEYIRVNYPRHHYSLKMFELSLQAKDAAFGIEEPELPDGLAEPSSAPRSTPNAITNQRRTSLYSYQQQPSNQSVVESAPNQNLPDNRSIVESDPNQKRLDNRTLIEIRKRSLSN